MRTRVAKRSPRSAERLTEAIWAALAAQSLTVTAEAAWGDTICDLAADLARINARRSQIAADIETAFMEHPLGKVLASLCGFGPRTSAEPSLRSATPTASPTQAASPPTPGSHPWTGNQAPAPQPANPEAATTASKTPCSKPRSSPLDTTPTPAPSTNANAPKANATTQPSSASPAAAATSSWPCSKHKPPTNHPNPKNSP